MKTWRVTQDYWAITESTSLQSDELTETRTVYSDEECTQPIRTVVTQSKVEHPGGTVETSLGVADFVNTTVQSLSVDGVTYSTGLQKTYTINLLDGNKVYAGLITDELTGESAATRSVQIDESSYTTRL